MSQLDKETPASRRHAALDLGRSPRGELAIAGCLALGWLLYLTPPWTYFLNDPDGGMFIYGATHLLATGAQPQVDLLSSYGPMSFYVRAVSQYLFGQRPISEMAVAWVGYTLGYVLLFNLVRRISASPVLAFFILILALVCIPRYYKFFVVLMPVLTATVGAVYIASPHRSQAFWLGATVGLAVLFRHDFGFYCLIGALAAWWLGSLPGTRVANGSWLMGGLIAVVGAWITAVAGPTFALPLLRDLLEVTVGQGAGLALPHPLRTWTQAWPTTLFLTVYSLPVLVAILLVALNRRLGQADKALGWMLTLMAGVTLWQSMHRSDVWHLLQTMAPGFILLGVCWRLYAILIGSPLARGVLRGATLLWVAVPIAAVAWPAGWIPQYSVAVVAGRLRDGWLTPAALRARIPAEAPSSAQGAAVLAATRMTTARERILVFPFAPQVYFFAERLMAGDTLLVAPGYFDQPRFEERIVASLRRDRPKLVMWDTELAFDGLPKRNAIFTHATVYRFVTENFQRVGEAGSFALFVDRTTP
jgi:hypothetical protein